MADDMKMVYARKTYQALLTALDNRGWNYDADADELVVRFGVNGDDLPMNFVFVVDADASLVSMYSPLGFTVAEDKRLDLALACCVAGNMISDGSFDCSIEKGRINFRLTAPFHGHAIEPAQFDYMCDCGCAVVDHFNDRFFAMNKGLMTLQEFAND